MGDTLIIFDCDGVLVDSEPLAARVLAEAIRDLGLAMTDAEAAEVFLGCSMEMVVEIVEARLGRPVEARFAAAFHDQLHVEIQRDLAAIDGVRDAIQKIQLHPRIGGLCVASNGKAETVELSLDAVGLLSFFPGQLYTASMVERGKPDPDLFLHTAREMNFTPENCIVIEDSEHGVNAAKAARMRVFRYAPKAVSATIRDHITSVAGAKIFTNMNQLSDLITEELQH